MTTNIGTSIQLCYSWNMQAPKIKVSLTFELLLLLLKLCLYKGEKSDTIPSITVTSTVGLLFAMNRKGCWEITSIGASFTDIIFPPNALKCKYLTVVMYLSQSWAEFALISYCYYIKRHHQAEGKVWTNHLKFWLYLLCKPWWGAWTRLKHLGWPCAQIYGAVQRLHRSLALMRGRMRVDSFLVISGTEAGWMLYWVRHIICAL